MNTPTQITIDLPKLNTKPASIFHKKLQKMLPPHFIAKHSAKRAQDPGRALIQRYKTELYQSQPNKCENQFMQFVSGQNRSSCDESLAKKKSFSFISTEADKDCSPQIRDFSINFRKRRLPRLITMKGAKQQMSIKTHEKEPTFSNFSFDGKMELITFYPHKQFEQQSPSQ